MSELSGKEQAWWKDFKALIRRMPKTIELNVQYHSIGINKAGTREAYFLEHGDFDALPEIETFYTERITPHTEYI